MFLSRRYRPNKWPFWACIGLELPLTIGLLILFGIASPNLYRTKLWQDGSDNGFNSSPTAQLYAAANYRPYTVPKPWSQFITNFNVVISVLSMFAMLVKSIMYVVNCFPPILSVVVHLILMVLYIVSVIYQSASDTTDPNHPQYGPPWYITKSCSVTHNPSYVGYCQQAKAAFALTVSMLGVFALYFGFAAWSCFPSKAQQAEYAAEKQAKQERYAQLEGNGTSPDSYAMPDTPGLQSGLNPMTPRTMAFNSLGGTKGLSYKSRMSASNGLASPSFAIRSPDLPRSPMTPGFSSAAMKAQEAMIEPPLASPQPYFPPPPKSSTKK